MSLQGIKKENIEKAFNYIDENGCPSANESTRYFVVFNEKEYPPKYVLAVARHLQDGVSIDTSDYNAIEAKNYLSKLGYTITEPADAQVKYTLTITADSIDCDDERFSIDNIGLGDQYKPITTYFENASGEKIERERNKGERRNSNQTLPRLACQIYENKIFALSDSERIEFPICKYNEGKLVKGIYFSVDDFRKNCVDSIEYLIYSGKPGTLVFYCWNIFSTLLFVQECLKRYGSPNDKFVLVYRDKKIGEEDEETKTVDAESIKNIASSDYVEKYANILKISKNIIFHGAPGTGKTYLAKEIASWIVSDNYTDDYEILNDAQKEQIGFVQFHPSYDYTDFVEGLRPTISNNGNIGFELQPGTFKKFIETAIENEQGINTNDDVVDKYITDAMDNGTEFTMKKGGSFVIEDGDETKIIVKNTSKDTGEKRLKISTIKKLLYSGIEFNNVTDIAEFLNLSEHNSLWSYYFPIITDFKEKHKEPLNENKKREKKKNYVFIIDEINRGEISKIFGELFFAIEPSYRGIKGSIMTQYSNLHDDPNEKLYIPDNVYIIGTMNDIDRSVDSFDFAMRRRFRFINLKADECLEMLDQIGDENIRNEAIARMSQLNEEISNTEGLNESYQIGASYFLKLNDLKYDFEQLWSDYLLPLLEDYVKGFVNEHELIENFKRAYSIKTVSNIDNE